MCDDGRFVVTWKKVRGHGYASSGSEAGRGKNKKQKTAHHTAAAAATLEVAAIVGGEEGTSPGEVEDQLGVVDPMEMDVGGGGPHLTHRFSRQRRGRGQ